jgi:hypothetical protein
MMVGVGLAGSAKWVLVNLVAGVQVPLGPPTVVDIVITPGIIILATFARTRRNLRLQTRPHKGGFEFYRLMSIPSPKENSRNFLEMAVL